jgi:prepilin-type N-terminal cleavage/methylation domain-containing protein
MRDRTDIALGWEILGRRTGDPAVAGFSLIELLVVIGLIAFLAGSLGLALRRPGGGVALQAGQATLAAVCRAARVRAASTGDEVRLVVAVDPTDAAGRLRYLQVVHEDPANPDHWLAEGAGIWLPPGVYVVPPRADAVPGDATWPETHCSTALTPTAQALIINGAAASLFYSVSFTARGTTRGGTVLVTGGSMDAVADISSLRFGHPDDVRGVRLRASGALSLLAGAGALDP